MPQIPIGWLTSLVPFAVIGILLGPMIGNIPIPKSLFAVCWQVGHVGVYPVWYLGKN